MKLVIVGGVAGGATAAARARRIDEFAEIVMFERGPHISFANCGLPYYISGDIQDREELFVTTPEELRDRFRIDVRVPHEVRSINRAARQIEAKDLSTGEVYKESYDKLILSPGASPIRPPIEGVDLPGIHTLRNVPDTDCIHEAAGKAKSAVVVGGGFIGLEMAESLARRGIRVTIVEMLEQVLPPLDYEMASFVHQRLLDNGVDLRCGDGVESFHEKDGKVVAVTNRGCRYPADMVVLSIGVKPDNRLAREAGLEVGERGGIVVNEYLQTSDPDIYAAGDATQARQFVSRTPLQIPLAGPANKQGRIAADNALGGNISWAGIQGTAIVGVFGLTAASTGESEKYRKSLGRPCKTSYTHSFDHAAYYPGAERMAIKLVFHPDDGRVLGAQIVGEKGVDKRIDVIATAIRAKMTVFDLEELELAYAPQYGSAKDPVNMAGFVAANLMRGDLKNINWNEILGLDRDDHVLIDLRDPDEIEEHGTIEGSVLIPLNELRGKLDQLDRKKTYVPYCAVGMRGYYGYRILAQHGFKAVNLAGGYATYKPPVEQKKYLERCRLKTD